MIELRWLLYIVSGAIAGAINGAAGGGSLLLFPLLIGLGLPPITANATMSLIVQPGALTATFGYRKQFKEIARHYYLLLIPAVLGGVFGASLLVHTSTESFEHIVPYLMIVAILLLIFQSPIHNALYKKRGTALRRRHHLIALVVVAAVYFIVSSYGGYFGVGFGIITLSFLGLTQLTSIQQMNGLKNLTGLVLGTADCAYFIIHHVIDWHIIPLFIIGSLVGGYFGATYSRDLHPSTLRRGVIAIGCIMTVVLFYRYYN
jgi:uncharacterized membrane protein YfcA